MSIFTEGMTDGVMPNIDSGAGKAASFIEGYATGYVDAINSDRFQVGEETTRLLNADEAIRKEYAIRVGVYDPDDSTPCWDDIVEAAIELGKSNEQETRANRSNG